MISIFENPEPFGGWVKFSFDDSARVSYIDDFPTFVFKDFVNAYEHDTAFCATFDSEEYSFSILGYDVMNLEYILRKDEITIKELPFYLADFMDALVYEVEKDIEKWARFPAWVSDEKDVHESLNDLKKYINKTKEYTKHLPHKEKLIEMDEER